MTNSLRLEGTRLPRQCIWLDATHRGHAPIEQDEVGRSPGGQVVQRRRTVTEPGDVEFVMREICLEGLANEAIVLDHDDPPACMDRFSILPTDIKRLRQKAGPGPCRRRAACYSPRPRQRYPNPGKFSISSKPSSISRNFRRMRLMNVRTLARYPSGPAPAANPPPRTRS